MASTASQVVSTASRAIRGLPALKRGALHRRVWHFTRAAMEILNRVTTLENLKFSAHAWGYDDGDYVIRVLGKPDFWVLVQPLSGADYLMGLVHLNTGEYRWKIAFPPEEAFDSLWRWEASTEALLRSKGLSRALPPKEKPPTLNLQVINLQQF